MQKGSKHTEETRQRMSEGRKGKGIGNTNGSKNKGRVYSEETIKKKSEVAKANWAKKKGLQND